MFSSQNMPRLFPVGTRIILTDPAVYRKQLKNSGLSSVETEGLAQVAISYNDLADIEVQRGNADMALKNHGRSLTSVLEIAEKEPMNAEFQRDVVYTSGKLADIEQSPGNYEAVLEKRISVLEIRRQLSAANSDNAVFKREVAIVYNQAGDAHALTGEADLAVDSCHSAHRVMEELLLVEPANPVFLNDLVYAKSRLAGFFQHRGNVPNALSHYSAAREVLLGMAESGLLDDSGAAQIQEISDRMESLQ